MHEKLLILLVIGSDFGEQAPEKHSFTPIGLWVNCEVSYIFATW